jgi:hypothetical protein
MSIRVTPRNLWWPTALRAGTALTQAAYTGGPVLLIHHFQRRPTASSAGCSSESAGPLHWMMGTSDRWSARTGRGACSRPSAFLPSTAMSRRVPFYVLSARGPCRRADPRPDYLGKFPGPCSCARSYFDAGQHQQSGTVPGTADPSSSGCPLYGSVLKGGAARRSRPSRVAWSGTCAFATSYRRNVIRILRLSRRKPIILKETL